MKIALVARSPLGLFAFSENGELLYYKLFSTNHLEKFLSKELDRDFLENLEGYQIRENDTAYRLLGKNFREYAHSLCNLTDEKLNELLSDFAAGLTRRSLHGSIGRDRLIVQAVRSLDDLVRAKNVFQERLYEWYSLHYPEMKNTNVDDIVAKHGRRESIPGFKSSLGVDLTDDDENALRSYAFIIQNLESERKKLEAYISLSMKETAANLSNLIDPVLGARLMASAGSLEKMARMPASTIQLLGAEKALFRHLSKKGRSPKYGIIYNSSLIQSASSEQKGKVARILSSKLMLAARIDYYSGRYDEKMKKEMMEEIGRLK